MSGSFFSELRRRNVFKVATAYIVIGWLLIQAGDVIAPQLHLPEWAPRLVTFLIILGFPLALFLAWVFELTPQGVQVTEGQFGSKRFYALTAILTVVALGWFGYGLRDEPVPEATTAAPGPPSIAVLAFQNMSPDPENAYFADGISEEILNILAGVEGLRVASRTSAFSFRDGAVPIPEIARTLNVGHVLEGSVRRHENEVRITAQLIRADTDEHLWSQSYDRDLTHIFRVQEEIAQSIADALGEVLGTRRVEVTTATTDLEGYERFLRGRARFHERRDLDEAIEDLRFATVRDPAFGEAWAYLAATHFVAPGYRGGAREAESMRAAGQAVEEARKLIPDHPMVLGTRGMMEFQRNMDAGLDLLRRAAQRASQDSTPVMWYGLNLLLAGYIDEAIPVLERSRDMDPLVGINRGYLSLAYLAAGREDAAWVEAERGSDYRMDAGLYLLAVEMAARGETERAAALLRPLVAPLEEFMRLLELMIEAILDHSRVPSYLLELTDAWVAEELIAMDAHGEFLDRMVAAVDDSGRLPRYSTWLRSAWLPSAGPVREDPRYFRVARTIGMVQLWETRGYPPGCRRVGSPDGDRLDCPGMGR